MVDLEPVIPVMAELHRDGTGWIVFEPGFDPDDAPPPSGLFGLFSSKGPAVPDVSWVPGTPTEVGIRHGSGPKAVPRLAEVGHPVPDRWVLRQDHSRRGLVLAVPPDEEHERTVRWLLEAATLLTSFPIGDDWRAAVYRPPQS